MAQRQVWVEAVRATETSAVTWKTLLAGVSQSMKRKEQLFKPPLMGFVVVVPGTRVS